MSNEKNKYYVEYQKRSQVQLSFKMTKGMYDDVIDYWKSQENMRRKFIEVTRELIEKERQ